MFQNLSGWHIMFILITLAVFLTIVGVVIAIAVRSAGRSAPTPVNRYGTPSPTAPPESASERLAKLDRLRQAEQISEAEYQAKRAEINGV